MKGAHRVDSQDNKTYPAQVAGSRKARTVPFDGKPACVGLRNEGVP